MSSPARLSRQVATGCQMESYHHFMWRPSGRPDISIKDMKDTHLFNTVRMIWNNKMPYEARVMGAGEGPPRIYTFGPRHNDQFLMEMIRAALPELLLRWRSLTPSQREQLSRMASYYNRDRIPEERLAIPQ